MIYIPHDLIMMTILMMSNAVLKIPYEKNVLNFTEKGTVFLRSACPQF